MRVPLAVLLAAFLPAHARASVQAQPKGQVVRQLDGDTTNLALGPNALLTVDPDKEPMPALRIEFFEGRTDTTVPLPRSVERRR